ncbi:hypothetical protein [Fibrella forsythiae]|uniref:Uncharacterized protein n=1 Tax=Fibrella forsythiae TaxID=2817061 RepID=A0ABS3JT34_9BACT|nr:hypothetical protein [Fibrella forsythiae]MBO0953180.1 hypothetical protein [Fibrella forsythiae]
MTQLQRHVKELLNDEAFLKAYEHSHQNLLGKCLSEGMADFVAELILGQPLARLSPSGYLAFGASHEQRIWAEFTREMNQPFNWNKGWLYNERIVEGKAMRDLGYFIGYQICRQSHRQKAGLNVHDRAEFDGSERQAVSGRLWLQRQGIEVARRVRSDRPTGVTYSPAPAY